MSEEVFHVRISEFQVAAAPAVLVVYGLGSCVAVAIHDPETRLGGLAHILLPGPAPETKQEVSGWNEFKYADRALAAMVEEMVRRGARLERMTARIAGGANMFFITEGLGELSGVKHGIGERNVEAVRELLQRLGVPITGEDTGGSRGRKITFETDTGRFTVSNARGGSRDI